MSVEQMHTRNALIEAENVVGVASYDFGLKVLDLVWSPQHRHEFQPGLVARIRSVRAPSVNPTRT